MIDPPDAGGRQQKPPEHILSLALEVAVWSPCRSKRGVVIFRGDDVVTHGFNYKPHQFACDGSITCKATCRREAIHAEQQALLYAGLRAQGADLLHVKAVDGGLVTSGGPSCVECSKLALVAGIAGVWLYHAEGWRRYTAVEFHRASLAALAASVAPSPQHMCSGCHHRWEGDLKGAELCGDCWRAAQSVVYAQSGAASVAPVRRWRCADCGLPNVWDALECVRCRMISPPDKERWEVQGFARSPRERLSATSVVAPVRPETEEHIMPCVKCGELLKISVTAEGAGDRAASPSELQIAERIARQAHEGDIEESTGDPYIRHIERVVAMVDGADAKAVAWLHDALEDTDVTAGELRRAGISQRIINAVWLLTRHNYDGRSYQQYIEDIQRAANPLALAVKLADLRDHLRPNCPERLRPRYERAMASLTPVIETEEPR